MEQGVKQWTELPLWRTHAGVWAVDSSRAVEAGLRCRPIGETVADTWDWLRTTEPQPGGLDPAIEAAILGQVNR